MDQTDQTVFSVPIPLDDDGFLDRQCHFQECGRYFKVLSADWEVATVETITCPFCGHVDEPNNFTTDEQQEFIEQSAVAIAQEQIRKILGGFAKNINRRQTRKSFIQIRVQTKFSDISVPISPDAIESMRLQITCDQCSALYAVVGAGFFCPLCGKNSARHTFEQAISKTRNAVEVARRLASEGSDRDAVAEARRDALESQIENLVTTFQRFGEAISVDLPSYSQPAKRNLFQRLRDASDYWEAGGGLRFQDALSESEWGELTKFFQQRHLLSHQDGFVDADYLSKSGDVSYRVGQRLIVAERHVLQMADLVAKLGNQMQADVAASNRS